MPWLLTCVLTPVVTLSEAPRSRRGELLAAHASRLCMARPTSSQKETTDPGTLRCMEAALTCVRTERYAEVVLVLSTNGDHSSDFSVGHPTKETRILIHIVLYAGLKMASL
jgi:hypothetical protein